MDLVAAVMATRPGVGVSGSHGKGTVSPLTAAALREAGMDPLVVLGVEAPQLGGAVRLGAGPAVMEVDEFDLAAQFVTCEVAAVVNLDDDHPHLCARLPEVLDSVGASSRGPGARSCWDRRRVRRPSPRARVPAWRVGREFTARVACGTPTGTGRAAARA
jgi:UDP-N-acetylmuramate-alanine ligase